VCAVTVTGISVHNAGVYCTGLLVGGDRYFYSEAPAEVRARAESWGRISDDHGVPLASIAIKFGLMPTPVSQVVIGMGSPAEVSQSIEWAETPVPNGVWTDAVAQGLLPANVTDMFDDAMQ
jgi:D-threo-aldose 1-dehydrogenase